MKTAIPDRDVHEEDPRPRERLDEDAAEQQSDSRAADRDRGPDAHRFRALGALGEGRRDDGERRGRDQRATEPLHAAEDDEELRARREPVEEGGDGEDHDADEEHALAAEEVARAASEQQEPAEDERVRVHDPLEVGVRHVEVGLDRRQRDVHDRGVEDHHELRHAHEREHEPRVDVEPGTARAGCGVLAHETTTLATQVGSTSRSPSG